MSESPEFSKDLDLIVSVLEEALTVIDDNDPDRNLVRCMRQLRRLFDTPNLRSAVRRLKLHHLGAPDVRHKCRSRNGVVGQLWRRIEVRFDDNQTSSLGRALSSQMSTDNQRDEPPKCPTCRQPMNHTHRIRRWPQGDIDVFSCKPCDMSVRRAVQDK